MRRTSFIPLLAAILAMAGPAAALGQEEGVTLDPGDPAAKEYSLPTEEARRETSEGTGAAVRHGANDSALFGEGVSRDDDAPNSGSGTAASSDAGDEAGNTDEATPAATGTDGARGSGAEAQLQQASVSEGPSSALVLGGGGLLVLAAAGIGGLVLRQTRGPADS